MVRPQPSSRMSDALGDTSLSQTGSSLSKERLSVMLGLPPPWGVPACGQRRDDAGHMLVLWLVSRRIGGSGGSFPRTFRPRGGTNDGRDTRGRCRSTCPVLNDYAPKPCCRRDWVVSVAASTCRSFRFGRSGPVRPDGY